MSLRSVYERFISSPSPHTLSGAPTLHYVTTLTSFSQADAIVKHLESQEKNAVKRKSWKILDCVEGSSSLALEVETTLEFISNGGAYLPGLDTTFIVGHIVTLPVTHFVHFDRNEKISQIRLTWDQASLLKQVEVIGARGKNWPVHDGREHIKLISRSSTSAAAVAPATPPRGRGEDLRNLEERSFSPSKKYIKDPHASLDLSQSHDIDESQRVSMPNPVAPRQLARPAPREHSELFAAGHEDLQASPGGSPMKEHQEKVIPPKGASNRRFEGARLFEDDQDVQEKKEKKIYKTNPARYNHFDIGDHDAHDSFQHNVGRESQPKHVPMVSRSKKNGSSWDFDDFATPEQGHQKVRNEDTVHFSLDNKGADENRPVRKAPVSKGREANDAHFDIEDKDDSAPAPRRIIARTKAALGLYADNQIYDEELESRLQPLSNATNKGGRKNNDLESHWGF